MKKVLFFLMLGGFLFADPIKVGMDFKFPPFEYLDDAEKIFTIRYPKASAPTDTIAIAASPCIFVFCPVRRSRIAHSTVPEER